VPPRAQQLAQQLAEHISHSVGVFFFCLAAAPHL